MKYGEVKKFEAKVKFKIEIMVTGSISIRWLFQHLADVTWSKLTLIYRNSNTKAKNNPRFFYYFSFVFCISASILVFHLSLFGFLCKSHEGHCSKDKKKI